MEFPPTKAYPTIHMNSSSISVGLNYNKGILTFLEPYEHTVPNNGDLIHKKITRWLLSNKEDEIIKVEKISTYVISDLGTSLTIHNNRLFSRSHPVNVKIYSALDGRLIESLPDYIYHQVIENKNFVALKSKTHLMLYCTINDKKNMIDRRINGILYYGTENHVGTEEQPPSITQLNDNYVIIKMYSGTNKNEITTLYKVIEDSGVDEKDQCSVCFGYAEKNKALVPCGHTQFCDKCIRILTKCPLCDKNINSILNIYT